MLCRLCLLDCDDLLEIFDKEGLRLRIGSIVAQHFGYELQSDDQVSSKICTTCWLEVENFHAFYVDVRRAQEKLKLELAKNADPDPDTDEEIGNSENDCLDNSEEFDKDECADSGASTLYSFWNGCMGAVNGFGKDTSNIIGDIDVFAAPSRTCPTIIEATEINKNNIIVVDIGSTKCDRSLDDDFSEFYTNGMQNYHSKEDEDEFIRSRFKSLGIPGLNDIIDRNELSIIAMPKTDDDSVSEEENEQEISKYIELNCELCGAKFKIFSDLKHHFRIVHKIAGYVVCCNEKLFKRVQLLGHVMKHLDRSRLTKDLDNDNKSEKIDMKKCPLCWKLFDSKKQLSRHLREKHIPAKRQNRQHCQQCGLTFKSRHILHKHIRSHLIGANDNLCTICDKKCGTDTALHRHLNNVHYKERKYQCSMCDKAFKWSINLREHMAIHTGKSLYNCQYCSKTFNASSNLHSHRKKNHRDEWEEERRRRLQMITLDEQN